MADFEEAAKKTIHLEGEYTDGKGDYGGETKFGISKRAYPELDIKNLTKEDARAIYKRDYWDKLLLDRVGSQAIANELFDTSVNKGWRDAAKYLQECLNVLSGANLTVDGLVGPKTLEVYDAYIKSRWNGEAILHTALNGLQFGHYWNEATHDENQRAFINGWLANRVTFKEV